MRGVGKVEGPIAPNGNSERRAPGLKDQEGRKEVLERDGWRAVRLVVGPELVAALKVRLGLYQEMNALEGTLFEGKIDQIFAAAA